MNVLSNQDRSRVRQLLQSRSHVYAIPSTSPSSSKMMSPRFSPMRSRSASTCGCRLILDFECRSHRLNGTGELSKEAVSCSFVQPPLMPIECGLDDLPTE